MFELRIKTSRRTEGIDITRDVAKTVREMPGTFLVLYVPHTTCGIMINEHADPEVIRDVTEGLERMVPRDYPYRHAEGNADAHIKAALIGSSVTIPLKNGTPLLGTWQGIFFMEFDGPRDRKVLGNIV